MSATLRLQGRDAKWIFLAPISGVRLFEAVNYEHRIDRVTLVRAKNLATRRRRFGLPVPFSTLRHQHRGAFDRHSGPDQTWAVVRDTGSGVDTARKAVSLIREELAVLALSQLGFARRHQLGYPALFGERPHRQQNYVLVDSGDSSSLTSGRWLGYGTLDLEENWRSWQREAFYFGVLGILRREVSVSKNWYEDLRNAFVLVGQSLLTPDVLQAFLWNIIALELLLTKQGEKVSDTLPDRVGAFLGWTVNWTRDDYPGTLRSVYEKRCTFVHDGRRADISREDVYFTDQVIFNVLLNLVRHIDTFTSKLEIIAFADRVAAEHLLGVKPRVRPKTLQFRFRRAANANLDSWGL